MKKFLIKYKFRILLITVSAVLVLPAILPLFHQGFFVSDDGGWMIIRFSAFHQAFRDGQFPVRFLSRLNHGYGYPVANFLYPGFMYLAEPIHLAGFGFIDSIKILIGLSLIGSAIFTYKWLLRLFPLFPALVGALVYLYTPYHLYDLYKRGSIGEVVGLTIVPFIFWQIEKNNFLFSTLGIALLILSHNTLAVLFMPIIFFYWLTRVVLAKNVINDGIKLVYTMFLALGVSAFFWIPAIFELSLTRFISTQVADWQQYFADPALIGFGSMIVVATTVFTLLRYKKLKENNTTSYSLLFIGVGLVSVFMSCNYSRFVWQQLPVSFIQFPYRFLSLLIPSSAFLAAFFLSQLKSYGKIIFTIVLLVALFINVQPYLRIQGYLPQDESYYATNEDTTTVKNEYMPVWVKDAPIEHFKNKITGVTVEDSLFSNSQISFIAKTTGVARFSIIYYPGWKAFVNAKDVEITYKNAQGLIEIPIYIAPSKVELKFTETPLRMFADWLSFLSLLLVIIVPIAKKSFCHV
jgi:hypothetical protein